MKIIKLQSENFKKIKAISIEPTDNMVVISGRNGQGKTSVLDSILVALAGKQKDIVKPIRDGELRSTITLDLGKFIVIRTFKENASKLEIINKDGEFMTSPQTMLDELIGTLSFDPLEFANKSQKEQRATLLQLINVDIDSFAAKRKHFYDYRHETGIERKALPEFTISEIAEAERFATFPLTDVATLSAQLASAMTQNESFTNAQRRLDQISKDEESMGVRLIELKTQIEALERGLEALTEERKQLNTIQFNGQDLEGMRAAIVNADENNQRIRKAKETLVVVKEIQQIDAEYNKFTAEIEKIDRDLQLTLEKAVMPIEGLGVSDDGVTFNKIPFAQLSTSEKLKISMAIAMAMNPELRVIRILDGSLLDEDNMAIIRQMAIDKDFQVWVEVVDSSGKVGICIEDGEVKGDIMAEVVITTENLGPTIQPINPIQNSEQVKHILDLNNI